MAEERPHLATGECYHLYNRGVEKRKIFITDKDRRRFLITLNYYLDAEVKRPLSAEGEPDFRSLKEVKQPLIEILAYCLMPNHYHLLLRQVAEAGLRRFISQIQNSYTRYFNRRYQRVGPLLQGHYQAVHVKNDEQLLHVSRYIHLNPCISRLSQTISFPWSSIKVYTSQGRSANDLCSPALIRALLGDQSYAAFVNDFKDYALSLEMIKHLLHD